MLHFVSWNVNGLRSIIKKDFIKDIKTLDPDAVCLQETKASEEEVKQALTLLPDYKVFANESKGKKGYSGTAILTKADPIGVTYDLGVEKHDQQGRVVTAEFAKFFLTTVYTPNAGEELSRLAYREEWDHEFFEYLTWLDKRKPVIVCGDFNVAHEEIDIAKPKENYNKSAGYTQKEIDGFKNYLDVGFTDTYRSLHPKAVKYTYWNYWLNSRERNVGWRIDYFLASNRIVAAVKEAEIFNELHGSDHCPVGVKVTLD